VGVEGGLLSGSWTVRRGWAGLERGSGAGLAPGAAAAASPGFSFSASRIWSSCFQRAWVIVVKPSTTASTEKIVPGLTLRPSAPP
jgi:hypothetical protein